MDTFFSILKKSLVATIFVIFAFVATYIPQPFNEVETVEAGGLGLGSTEPTQIANNVQLGAVNIATTASAAFDSVTSWATGSLWVKENILDGIGWAIAKRIVSSMVRSLINWINSGFQGSPSFVQDLKGFLLQAADEAIGEFIADLGGIGSFICSPFRLDVQISVALQYSTAREGQSAPTCTLSGIIDNIEGFISGTFSDGGWKDWFNITSQPQTYTPYGSMLSAQASARASIINAQGEEIKLLDFGDGFLSGEICEVVHGANSPREDCFITKPGKIIEEALSFNLDSGRQSLIAADEINEIIAALLGQLANMALTGVSGLLGLSSGSGYSYSGYAAGSYLDQVVTDQTVTLDLPAARTLMADALAVQVQYNATSTFYQTQLIAYEANTSHDATRRAAAGAAADDALEIINTTGGPGGTIAQISALLTEFDNPATTDTRRGDIITEYTQLTIYTESEMTASVSRWQTLIRP